MQWLSMVVLWLVSIGYLFIGAAVFMALESKSEGGTKPKHTIRDFLVNTTLGVSNTSGVDQQQLEAMIVSVLTAYDQGLLENNKTIHPERKWTFMGAFCFSISVVTTVGYGDITPTTRGGQIFCIFYALCGIPLNGVLLIEVGRKLSSPIKAFRNRSHDKNTRMMKSASICVIVTLLLIIMTAFVYHKTEDWAMVESIYYTVITFTTIGFGDYVAVYHGRSEYSAVYQLLNSLWIFVGLAWASATVSDINDVLTAKVDTDIGTLRRTSRQINHTDDNTNAEFSQR